MTTATRPSPIKVETAKGDVRTTQQERTWEQFESLQKGFENSRGVRLSYYNGVVGILMPGAAHELFTGLIGFLIETFLFQRNVDFKHTGSMTQEKAGAASAQSDRSYEIQGFKLSVEINFTSGDISKLQRYQALEVNEVWVWEDGVLEVYHLDSQGYEQVSRSLIPALSVLDLEIMAECILIGETSSLKPVKSS